VCHPAGKAVIADLKKIYQTAIYTTNAVESVNVFRRTLT
jgi:hypothetical protein